MTKADPSIDFEVGSDSLLKIDRVDLQARHCAEKVANSGHSL